MKWIELTTRQLASMSRETICILPLGATEQHGPRLLVVTDQIIADAAEKGEAILNVVVPAIKNLLRAYRPSAPGTTD